MARQEYELLCVGNALVDVISHAKEDFVAEKSAAFGIAKGGMALIDETQAVSLYDEMGPAIESSGGSAANTIAGFASFGGKGAYIGKTADDQLGTVFRHDMTAMGVAFSAEPLVGAATGRCLILVTPDGQRTMNAFLGAATELAPDDIDETMVSRAAITYLEGYLFDPPKAKKAFQKAGVIAHTAGQRLAMTLSDPFCVDRHREDFREMVDAHVDLLFANEDEILSLYETDDFSKAMQAVSGKCEIAVLTRSEKGAVIVNGGKIIEVPAQSVNVVDTTGAGDQFAAGFLYGFAKAMPLEQCGRLGVLAASEVISHMGPRPEIDYAGLIEKVAA